MPEEGKKEYINPYENLIEEMSKRQEEDAARDAERQEKLSKWRGIQMGVQALGNAFQNFVQSRGAANGMPAVRDYKIETPYLSAWEKADMRHLTDAEQERKYLDTLRQQSSVFDAQMQNKENERLRLKQEEEDKRLNLKEEFKQEKEADITQKADALKNMYGNIYPNVSDDEYKAWVITGKMPPIIAQAEADEESRRRIIEYNSRSSSTKKDVDNYNFKYNGRTTNFKDKTDFISFAADLTKAINNYNKTNNITEIVHNGGRTYKKVIEYQIPTTNVDVYELINKYENIPEVRKIIDKATNGVLRNYLEDYNNNKTTNSFQGLSNNLINNAKEKNDVGENNNENDYSKYIIE